MNMTTEQLTSLAIAGGILFAAYKFGPAAVKAGAIAVGAVMIAKQVPYVKDVL